MIRALVDTGCTTTIADPRIVSAMSKNNEHIIAVDGSEVMCSVGSLRLSIAGHDVNTQCLVLSSMLEQFKLVIGMDIIQQLEGVTITKTGQAEFKQFSIKQTLGVVSVHRATVLHIDDVDFYAKFDGNNWTIQWKWAGMEPELHNKLSSYKIDDNLRVDFDAEVQSWVDEGILQAVPRDCYVESVVPMMAVVQHVKGKTRPVLDYRALNKHVSNHSGSSNTCDDKLRKWRRLGNNVVLLDLRKAYLQIHVAKDMWKHQTVKWNNKYYYLTRLGFGLNCAPKIMTSILNKVLSLDDDVRSGTDAYMDDIIVNCDLVSPSRVMDHLAQYGLVTKQPEMINGARALGLQIRENKLGQLMWSRGNDLPIVPESVTRRELFSVCGMLTGHYPVAGWLRIACSFVKRHSDGSRWDDLIGDTACAMLRDIILKVEHQDPVRGAWCVSSARSCDLWCDASSLATGCAVEIDGVIVEDGAWMRKKDDNAHINLSELDAILKGVNMALKWSVSDINIKTDSATVYGWLNSSLYSTHTIKTKGMNEMLVKRRLGVLRDLCSEYKLTLSVQWVCSDKNKADYLTRVPKRWIDASAKKSTSCVSIKAIHDVHHLGIDRTHYLAKLEDPEVTRGKVADVINSCMQCQSIDPAPQNWDKGHLSAIDNWQRLAVDVTHYNRVCYLTCVDCGPSRFAIWRRIHDESAPSIVAELEMIIRERGPPEQILMDNGLSFRSTAIRKLLDKWHIQGIYRCAYRAEGNGVVERNHRTIKRMAARSNNSVLDMVHWYNTTPKYGTNSCTAPAAMTYKYSWRVPTSSKESTIAIEDVDNRYKIGDEVFVKPPVSRCTTPWGKGVVTEINSDNNVEVNGIPRHVADLRRVPDIQAHEAAGNPDPGDDINIVPVAEPVPRVEARPQRERRPPERHGNNIYDG